MAIYIRDEQGDLTPLNIPAINGRSAYEVACDNGFEGTEQEWLNSLQGENGSEEVYVGSASEAPITASMVIDVDAENEYDGFFTDAKYDYLGKPHSRLKDVNDSNVEHLLRKVNVQKYEGSSIIATNTYAKQVNGVILKGVTKYRDIDTGELIDNFEKGRDLELVGGKANRLIIESAKLALDNKEIVNIYNDMGYSNVKASLSDDGYFIMNADGMWGNPNKMWNLKPNTTYTIQASGEGVVNTTHYGNNGLKSEKWYRNYNEGYIQVVGTTDDTGIFGLLLRFERNKKVDFKVFEGDSGGKLIKYKSGTSEMNKNIELNSINEVYDYADLNSNTHVKNIGCVTLTGNNEFNIRMDGQKGDTARFLIYVPNLRKNSNYSGDLLSPNYRTYKAVQNFASESEEGMTINGWATAINFHISVQKLGNENSIESFKNWLSRNNIVVYYPLQEPIVTKIDLQEQKVYSYDGTTCYTCKSELGYPAPILSIEVPTDLASLVQAERTINKQLQQDQNIIIESQLAMYESMNIMKSDKDNMPQYIKDLYELAYKRGIRTRKEVDTDESAC